MARRPSARHLDLRRRSPPHHHHPPGEIDEDAARLMQIVAEREIGGPILGLPLNMDGRPVAVH